MRAVLVQRRSGCQGGGRARPLRRSPGTPARRLDYAGDRFYEREVRSVAANTRADGEALLAEAARIPVRLTTTTFPLAEANRALGALKRGAFAGSAVLVS